MEAVRLHPNPDNSEPYSGTNPAPSSTLRLDINIPIPEPLKAGEVLIKIEAAGVVRDALTWPETYLGEYPVLGNDFAGTVVSVSKASAAATFEPGDQVYGMTAASRAGTWSEYTIVSREETCIKPKSLTWTEAAAVPMSVLTAYQALFEHAGLAPPALSHFQPAQTLSHSKEARESDAILITGASGSVGLYLVQLAKLTGLHVVTATRSNERNKDFLKRLGADEVVEYKDLAKDQGRFHTIIDTTGGDVLKNCWSLIKESGTIVTIDSSSYDFVKEHQALGLCKDKENVTAVFFIVSPSRKDLKALSAAFDSKLLEAFVAGVVPLADARLAYENISTASTSRGRVVLMPRHGQ